MTTKRLVSVRSNCDFSLDYKTGTLEPQVEIILISSYPKYKLNSKRTEITRQEDVDEFRIKTNLDGINVLIGELQLALKNANEFNQLGASLNAIIKSSNESKR
jgi:hypothetical protein